MWKRCRLLHASAGNSDAEALEETVLAALAQSKTVQTTSAKAVLHFYRKLALFQRSHASASAMEPPQFSRSLSVLKATVCVIWHEVDAICRLLQVLAENSRSNLCVPSQVEATSGIATAGTGPKTSHIQCTDRRKWLYHCHRDGGVAGAVGVFLCGLCD